MGINTPPSPINPLDYAHGMRDYCYICESFIISPITLGTIKKWGR